MIFRHAKHATILLFFLLMTAEFMRSGFVGNYLLFAPILILALIFGLLDHSKSKNIATWISVFWRCILIFLVIYVSLELSDRLGIWAELLGFSSAALIWFTPSFLKEDA